MPTAQDRRPPHGGAAPAPGHDGRTSAPTPGPALVLGIVLVALTVLASALAGPWHARSRPGALFTIPAPSLQPQDPTPSPTALPDSAAAGGGGVPTWLVVLLLGLGLVAAVLLGRVLARAARVWFAEHRPAPVSDRAAPAGELRGDVTDLVLPAMQEGVADAELALDRDVPPGDAVVAAWVALEHAAERSGVVRDPAETATEFTLDVLDATRADPTATRALLDLYLAARFSRHVLTDGDVAAARAALATIREGVRRSRTGTGDDDEPKDDESDETTPDGAP